MRDGTLKTVLISLVHPLRRPVNWAAQRGLLPSGAKRFFPWRWVLEPFPIYGSGWTCTWYPTAFDSIAHVVFWSGPREWEKDTSPVILDQIRKARCFIDSRRKLRNLHCFRLQGEPRCECGGGRARVPKVCAAQVDNVRRNGLSKRVTIINAALGESVGTVSFHQAEDYTQSSLAIEGYQGQQGWLCLPNNGIRSDGQGGLDNRHPSLAR